MIQHLRLKPHVTVLLLTLLLALAACQPVRPADALPATPTAPAAPSADETLLPADPDVRVGTLDNGLTYYIRRNTEPAGRADLWLVVNAGSVQEDEDQRGLAHFLEHMLFNGTENFPDSGVVDFLESIGMTFGPDVNAHTSFDETVYTIQVPTGDPAHLDQSFQVLEDWAVHATLDPEAVDAERGVIVEEWRLREQTAQGRIQAKTLPFLLGDSQYAVRLPIGVMDVVRSAPAETLRRYYETWYRPDLMAVIAVGDFDVDEVEGLIQEHFGALQPPADPAPRPSFDLPASDETRYLTVSDPEQTSTTLWFMRRRANQPIQVVGDLRADLVSDLFYLMLNERLDDIERQPDAPFLSASSGVGGLVRPASLDVVLAQTADGKVLDALETITTEVERARRYGFTAPELERAKAQLLNFYEQLYNERNNTPSSSFASDYQDNFLLGEAIPSIDYLYEQVQTLLPGITAEEVNGRVAELAATDNRLIYVTGPAKADAPLPSEQEMAATVDAVVASEIAPPVEETVASALIENPPAPAEVISTTERSDLGATIITLANGLTVWMKPTTFKDDQVVFSGFSPGGSSLVSDADFPAASLIDTIVDESGAGPFTASELAKLLAGKTLSAVPYIRELTEGIEGSAAPEDLETLFQLVHLYFTAPRADDSTFNVVRTREVTRLQNRAQDPNAALEDAFNRALYGDTIRRGQLPVDAVQGIDLDTAFAIYQERFADASDFTFVFVGAFDVAELTALAQTYLGTLPTLDREESWQNVAPPLPTGVVTDTVYAGEGERSIVQIVFTGPISDTAEARIELNAMAGVLDILLREELRETLGGVYSSGAYAFVQQVPEPNYFAVISFGTDPARVDELVDATFAQIRTLQEQGPTPEDVTKVKAQAQAALDVQLEDNSFWLQTLKDYLFYGGEHRVDFAGQRAAIDALSAESIQAAAQEYLREDRYVQVALFPAGAQPAEE